MVEIAKALHANAKLLILDEPTASLSDRETERLFGDRGQKLKSQSGWASTLRITHRMQEIRRIRRPDYGLARWQLHCDCRRTDNVF